MEMNIENELIEFIHANCLPQKTKMRLDPDDHLFNTGVLDSAGLIHFVGFIEKKFNISIPDDDLIPENFTSIRSITNYIRSKTKEPVLLD